MVERNTRGTESRVNGGARVLVVVVVAVVVVVVDVVVVVVVGAVVVDAVVGEITARDDSLDDSPAHAERTTNRTAQIANQGGRFTITILMCLPSYRWDEYYLPI